MHGGEPADEQVLRPVGVLIFVNHHEPELLGVLRTDALRLLEEVDGLEQQVVEVERARVLQRLEVVLVDLGDLLITSIPARRTGHHVWRFHPVFRMADARQRGPRLDECVIDVEVLQRLLDDGQLVGRVVDHEVPRQADCRRFAAQQSSAQRVKRRDPHATALGSEKILDASAHLFRGLVGERDGEDFVRLGVAVTDQVRDPAGDDACLA